MAEGRELLAHTSDPEEGSEVVPAQDVQDEENEESEELSRWTKSELDRIAAGVSALHEKNAQGKTLPESVDAVLKENKLVINATDFFDRHGVYSLLIPEAFDDMEHVVSQYRGLPTVVNDEQVQSVMDDLLDLIDMGRAQTLTLAGLKKLRTEIQVLRDLIFRHQKRSYVGKNTATAQKPSAPTLARPDSINHPWVEKHAQFIATHKLSHSFTDDPTQGLSFFTERFNVLFIQELFWLGRGATAQVATRYDDIRNKVDGIVSVAKAIDGKVLQSKFIFDTTDSAVVGMRKLADTLRFIDNAVLTTVDYGETSVDAHGYKSQGKFIQIPRLNFVVNRTLAADVAVLLKEGRYDMLAFHPMQLMLIQQAQAQVAGIIEYIKHEYARGGRTNADRMQRNQSVLQQFKQLQTFFDDARQERQLVLSARLEALLQKEAAGTLLDTEKDVLTMLKDGRKLWITESDIHTYGAGFDTEHDKFIKVFRPDRVFVDGERSKGGRTVMNKHGHVRTKMWWRLYALTTKYPSLITVRGKKEAAEVFEKRATDRKTGLPKQGPRKVPRLQRVGSRKMEDQPNPTPQDIPPTQGT